MAQQSCGCTAEDTRPVVVPTNPPGLDALAYRVGTRAAFVEVMERALGADPVLRRLGTREPADPVIALLDAGASMLDVLTFYQERIANEGFLRTATERLSVLELVRAIGYELRPGVAATTMLAFTVTRPPALVTVPGAPDLPLSALAVTTPPTVRVPVGTRAQNVPGQNELPHTFETVEEIEARPEWNAMRVPVSVLRAPQPTETEIFLADTATGLAAGDVLLLVGFPPEEVWEVRRVSTVRTVERPGAPYTLVTVDQPLDKHAETVHALRTRAALFGHNAMPWETLPASLRVGEFVGDDPHFAAGPYKDRQNSWADAIFAEDNAFLHLDRVHPQIVVGSQVVLTTPEHTGRFEVVESVEVGAADFGLSAQVTRLGVLGAGIDRFSPRNASVYARSEPLPMAERPIDKGLFGREIELADRVDGLTAGRFVAIRGIREDTGTLAWEVRQLAEVWEPNGITTLVLTEDLRYCYVRESVRINANLAPATEGETRTEILGSGDAARLFQEFTLTGRPLTHVSAPTPSGGRSTLRIRIDGVLWTEVDSLFAQPPTARVYITRLADDGTVTVRFGDGRTGAVPPTGQDNVVATYRVGTGVGGNLDTARISLLLTRPLGVDEVINPIAATGGDDPERLAKARQNAPRTVLTLDRIVSLRDYEDFAGSFAGIGKARASTRWNGESRIVQLVVAGVDGTSVDPLSALFANLVAGIDAARHTGHQVVVEPFRPRPFQVALGVAVTADRLASDVFATVTTALTEAFSFARRDFGQRVAASEVLAVVQAVPGVRGAVLTALHLTGTYPERVELLPAEPADLLTVADIALTELLEPLP
jgi:hypothetical protein